MTVPMRTQNYSSAHWNCWNVPVRWLAIFFVAALAAQAASITVNLGQTAQNFTMNGTGPNASGLGTYVVTMGACSASNGNTTCTLSGSFTGSTPGFTNGTYSLVSTYVGTGPSPFIGVEQSAGSNFFSFSSIPQTATITLTLTTPTGTVVAPLYANGQFPPGVGFGFIYSTPACSGTAVSSCTVSQIGVTSGSTITGVVTGTATFVQASHTYYFSQLAVAGGFQTTLTYVNYTPNTITCKTDFYSDSGTPLPVPFKQGTNASRTDELAPGHVIHDQTVANPTNTLSQGWAQATCDGPVAASVLYRYFQNETAIGEAGVNAETVPTTKFATFAQTRTGIAYANPSTTEAVNVTVTVISSTGSKLASTTIKLGPLEHGAANLGPLLNLQSFTGFVEITATGPIISLSLNAEAFPVFSSLPAGDLPSDTALVSP